MSVCRPQVRPTSNSSYHTLSSQVVHPNALAFHSKKTKRKRKEPNMPTSLYHSHQYEQHSLRLNLSIKFFSKTNHHRCGVRSDNSSSSCRRNPFRPSRGFNLAHTKSPTKTRLTTATPTEYPTIAPVDAYDQSNPIPPLIIARRITMNPK